MNDDTILIHHGIKGMKWGVRRYRNTDGTLTEKGRRRYSRRLNKALEKEMRKVADNYAMAYAQTKAFQDYESRGFKEKRPRSYSRSKQMYEKRMSHVKSASFEGARMVQKLLKDAGDLKLDVKVEKTIREGRAVIVEGITEKRYTVPVSSLRFKVS